MYLLTDSFLQCKHPHRYWGNKTKPNNTGTWRQEKKKNPACHAHKKNKKWSQLLEPVLQPNELPMGIQQGRYIWSSGSIQINYKQDWFGGSSESKNVFPQFSMFIALSKFDKYSFARQKLQNVDSPCINEKWHIHGNTGIFSLKLGFLDLAYKRWWRYFQRGKTNHVSQMWKSPVGLLQWS